MMEVKENKMDFLEDLDLYDRAMNNAYYIITGKKTLDDLLKELGNGTADDIALPFDPLRENGRSVDIVEMLIDYYEQQEDYERCAELTNVNTNASEY
jgi:glycosyltransferase A (GT-A) superfamily protein (DUF2064 family)